MVTLAVHVRPRSAEDSVLGWSTASEGRPELLVRLSSAPTDGKANAALIKLLAKELALPKSSITIKSGHASRHKILFVDAEQSVLDKALARLL
ncbi:MAG: DUF167 domain-containing protein [Coriobacteriales bacterium]|nr:DUF167 domain-containing protein [Coriobacteriales bacterium]